MRHIAKRIGWSDTDIEVDVHTVKDISPSLISSVSASSQLALFVGLNDAASPSHALLTSPTSPLQSIPIRMCLDCAPSIDRALTSLNGLKPSEVASKPALSDFDKNVVAKLPLLGSEVSERIRFDKVYSTCSDLWRRHSSDDVFFLVLFLVDQYVKRVKLLPRQDPDLYGIYKMLRYCGTPIINCVQNPTCKKALDALSSAGLNDQVRGEETHVQCQNLTQKAAGAKTYP